MSDQPGGDELPKKRPLNFDNLYPKIEHKGEVFTSKAGGMSVRRDMEKELKAEDDIDPSRFAEMLIGRALFLPDADTAIGPERAAGLVGDKAFLEKFIAAHPEFYSEFFRDEPGGKAEWRSVLEREEHETPDRFLLRAYRDNAKRAAEKWKETNEKLKRQFEGLTGSLSRSGIEALMRGNSAADRISELIGRTPQHDLPGASGWRTFEPVRPIDIPIIENPIHETNKKLGKLGASIDEMRELYVQQATMQQSLNQVATEILDNFVTGSKSAAKSSRNALVTAILAIVVTLVTFAYDKIYSDSSEEQLESQAQMATILGEIREEIRAQRTAAEKQTKLLDEAIERRTAKESETAKGAK